MTKNCKILQLKNKLKFFISEDAIPGPPEKEPYPTYWRST
jgi:hypothetical protein